MNAQELHKQSSQVSLLHVLPVEVFAAAHIPGSHNACVYETAFLDHVKSLGLDPAAPLIVYGAGEGSLDAITAAAKLRLAGFSHVETFEGGLSEWQAAGFVLDGTGALPLSPVPDGEFIADTAQSLIRWTGRNLFNHHSGFVKLSHGEVLLSHGQMTSARFVIDMTTVGCEDIEDAEMNAMLLAHLRTTDFFDTGNYPTAEFVAESVEQIEAGTDGTPNFRLHGTFSLRGISKRLEFPVVIATKDAGHHITAQGVLELDRTDFGSHYGSGKFFRFLGQHLVNDHIQLHVKIHARKKT
jgi:polyisoprenoid-binding protein YceI